MLISPCGNCKQSCILFPGLPGAYYRSDSPAQHERVPERRIHLSHSYHSSPGVNESSNMVGRASSLGKTAEVPRATSDG
jgi:hypothetical protein